MNKLYLKKKANFFLEMTNLFKNKGYNNNFFLNDLINLIKTQKEINHHLIKTEWINLVDKIKTGESKDNINFYFNIPFCKSKCDYCMYQTEVLKDSLSVEEYINSIIDIFHDFKDIFKNIKFKSLYIGGGTPSILSKHTLEKLFKELFENFNFEKDGEKKFEFNPNTMNHNKLNLLKNFGFNSVSFGVQSINKEILIKENRGYQNKNQIENIVNYARKCGFYMINADLIIGLKDECVEEILKNIKFLSNLNIDSVCMYPFQPTSLYLKSNYKNYDEFQKEMCNKLKIISRNIDKNINKEKYNIYISEIKYLQSGSPWFLYSKDKPFLKYEYSFDDEQECNCFGVGKNSCSYIYNRLRYNMLDINKFFGINFDEKNQKIYYILVKLSQNKGLDIKEYNLNFNSNFFKDFKKEILQLISLNKAVIKDHVFFLKVNDFKERFSLCMFFFDLIEVIKKYNEFKSSNIYIPKIKLGHLCNNKCEFCFGIDSFNKKKDNTKLLNQLKEVVKIKPKKVFFSGGEPTLYYKSILKIINILNINSFGIITNGRVFSDENVVRKLVDAGLDEVYVSIYGKEKNHDATTKVPGSFRQLKKGLMNLLKHNILVRVNYVCTKKNISDISDTIKYMSSIGIKRFNLKKFLIKGRAIKIYEEIEFYPNDFYPYLKKIDAIIKNDSTLKINFEFFGYDFFEGFYNYSPNIPDLINFIKRADLESKDCLIGIDNYKKYCKNCYFMYCCRKG